MLSNAGVYSYIPISLTLFMQLLILYLYISKQQQNNFLILYIAVQFLVFNIHEEFTFMWPTTLYGILCIT